MHYRRMDEGTDEDFAVLRHVHEQTLRAVPDRLFAMLGELKRDTAYNITRYDHCLQAATRALRDNKDDEYVAVALLHDVCEQLGPFNHGEVVASILRPFISRDNHWMLVPLHRGFDGFKFNGALGGPWARPGVRCCARRPGSA